MLRILLIIFLPLFVAKETHWRYWGGESSWCEISSFCCGSRQSPIPLYTPRSLDQISTAKPLQFINYDKTPKEANLTNNGHTVILRISNDVVPQIQGGNLEVTYTFDSLHFHWGNISSFGSEHTIDNKRFPIEMHIVNYKSKFDSLKDALDSKEGDAIAVLGVMFKIHPVNAQPKVNLLTTVINAVGNVLNAILSVVKLHSPPISDSASTPGIEKITSNLKAVRFSEQSKTIKPFPLQSLLPATSNVFFRYLGSLTTPNCDPVVKWTVLDQPGYITEQQLNQFRSLFFTKEKEKPADPLVNNFRSLQNGSQMSVNYIKTN